MGLTIWCNNDFSFAEARERSLLIEGTRNHRLLMFAHDQDGLNGEAGAALKSADLAFGSPSPVATVKSKNVRWVHLNSAGYSPYDKDEIKDALKMHGTFLTNSSAVYDEPCAQHLLAMITSLSRQLPSALDFQRGDHSWQMRLLRPRCKLLNEQTVLVLGFGAIGRRLVELLHPLGMNLIAVRRNVSGDEPVQIENVSRVEELLPIADHVVNVLPANEQTRNFLNASRLGKLKPGAIVYNIGRGSTIDQDALLKELQSGRIGAAYLDVTVPEPLPPDHPLWTTSNCYITPHAAGGHANEKERQVKHFLNNLRRFERGDDLLNRIL